jgi:hypothetical protein
MHNTISSHIVVLKESEGSVQLCFVKKGTFNFIITNYIFIRTTSIWHAFMSKKITKPIFKQENYLACIY